MSPERRKKETDRWTGAVMIQILHGSPPVTVKTELSVTLNSVFSVLFTIL